MLSSPTALPPTASSSFGWVSASPRYRRKTAYVNRETGWSKSRSTEPAARTGSLVGSAGSGGDTAARRHIYPDVNPGSFGASDVHPQENDPLVGSRERRPGYAAAWRARGLRVLVR